MGKLNVHKGIAGALLQSGQGLVSVFVGDNQVQIVSKGCKAMLTLFMALNNSTVFEGQNAAKYFQETIGCKSF